MLLQARVPAERDDRIRIVVAMLAFAYFMALTRHERARASQLLGVFQRMAKQYRDQLAAAFPGNESTIANALTAVSPSGLLDGATRNALAIALTAGFRGDKGSVFSGMPSDEAALGAWFTTTVLPLGPADDMFAVDHFAQRVAEGSAPTMVQNAVSDYIAGVASTPAHAEGNIVTRLWNSLMKGGGGNSTVEANGNGGEVRALEPATKALVPTPASMPTWGWWAVGIGGLLAVGILAWGIANRN